MTDVDVLIVGAGPVGLTLAIDLAWRGIDVTVVETRARAAAPEPKCNHVAARTMEIFRQWGIEQVIRDRGLQNDSDMFIQVESMAGREIGRTRPEPNLGQTPSWKSMVAQDAVEVWKEYFAGKLSAPTEPPLPRSWDQSACTLEVFGPTSLGPTTFDPASSVRRLAAAADSGGNWRMAFLRSDCCQKRGSSDTRFICASVEGFEKIMCR